MPTFPTNLRKPPMLRRGDAVGLVAPASPPAPEEIEQGLEHFRSLGLEPVLGDYVRASDGYLAGTDAERAQDFNRMARDPKIRA
ncbi:MAG TPA: LD-carboxypeptidase, partial [Verrucomicrobiae bacterium]|nr:LD-carboxypeptidase [Verrucomicrobiae bacterium]